MLYFELVDALAEFSDAEAGIFLRAAAGYARYGLVPDFEDRGLRSLWRLAEPKLLRDCSSYEDRCRKNRYNSYLSSIKRKYRQKFPGREPVEGVDFLGFEDWSAQIDGATASDRLQPETIANQPEPKPEPEPEPEPNQNKNKNKNKNRRGEPGGELSTKELHDAWMDAIKRGDRREAFRLDGELFRRGIRVDPQSVSGE